MRERAKSCCCCFCGDLSSLWVSLSQLSLLFSSLPLSLFSLTLLQDSRRMLHAVYRVGDMDDSIAYYRDTLGMKLLRFRDIKEVKN